MWRYVLPHKGIGIIAVIGMAATALIEASLVYLLEPLMDEALVARNLDTAKWLPIAFIAIFIARGIAGFATEASLGWIGRSVISSLRREVFNKFLTLPTRFFDERTAGPLLSRMTYNVEMVAESVTSVVTIAIRDVLTVFAAFGVMLIQSPRLTVFVVILFPVIALLIRVLGVAFRRYSNRIQDSVGEVTQVTEEIVRGNWVVKMFGGYDYERDRLAGVDERNRKQNLKLIRVRSMGVAVTQTIFGFGVALVIYMASRESLEGNLTAGQFISFFSAMMLMLQPVRRITNVNATLQRGVAGADSLFSIMDEPDEADTGSIEKNDVRGDIEFRNVSFGYGEEDSPVLSDISMSIGAGQTLAIVGHSGSGKSTLVSLLPRFYEVSAGDILLDGVSIRDYKLSNLRDNISLVSQDVVLFNDTIANNLAYGELRAHSREELLRAAEAAHVLDFANEMPNGLDTRVGDRGALLSGGQKQRVAIGRALLKDAPVLILDEATSALDSKSERHIQEGLAELMKNRTTLVIAHRLSTVENADRIVVLDAGRIIESGTHAELLAAGGHYSALYRMQFSEQ
ncbi:MAG: lipid A export permease/ATP-binding protein MsbA [Gammaproteobacteria bacterium]|nr:lipid A export permease/ATP-binding protein MsbA [Gammaproteobacteria bacterium]MDH3905827.1 lipid A export permease/ATP-binding protein MsbA [Gammaproteobacteria bacterium]